MYTVRQIDAKQAREIVKKYHYSGKAVANSKVHLGIFDGDSLVGCLQYGPPMNGAKTSLKISDSTKMLELNRMVMADSEPRNAESQAISLCNKWLRQNTDVEWLLRFSDGKEGNVGYIYQATNWKYIGYIVSDSFYDLDGVYTHNVTVWHRYKEKHALRDTHTTDEIVCMNFNNVSKVKCKQHVYVFQLYKRHNFKHSVKDYPKKDKEVEILQRKWIQKDGVKCKDVEIYSQEKLSPIF